MGKSRPTSPLETSLQADAYTPDYGDVVWMTFDPQLGREQAGRRPALVLSPERYNRLTRLCLVCPITSQVKGFPFECRIPDGLPVDGVVLSDQVKSLSFTDRRSAFICRMPVDVIQHMRSKLKTLLFPS